MSFSVSKHRFLSTEHVKQQTSAQYRTLRAGGRKISHPLWLGLVFVLCSSVVLLSACNDDQCNSQSCSGHGSCSHGICTCFEGYRGDRCQSCAEEYIPRDQSCLPDPCLADENWCYGHGTCEKGTCTCLPSYDGERCSTCSEGYVDYPQCFEDPCLTNDNFCNGHGVCKQGKCFCKARYDGERCSQCASGYLDFPECRKDPCLYPNYCNSRGQCIDGVCHCEEGYQGERCNLCASGFFFYEQFNACLPIACMFNEDCGGHGTCILDNCYCDEGFEGVRCDSCSPGYIGFPDCRPDPCADENYCRGHGVCSQEACTCDPIYAGQHCSACREGFFWYPHCYPIPCYEFDTCNGHGECIDELCQCDVSFLGDSCDICQADLSSLNIEIISPENGYSGMWRTPIFRWKDLCEEEGYQIEIARDSSFTDIVHAIDLEADTTEYIMPPDILEWDTQYYWRVVAFDDRSQITSGVYSFDTQSIWLGIGDTLEGPNGYKIKLNRIAGSQDDWFIQCGIYKEQEDGYWFHLYSGGITGTRSIYNRRSHPFIPIMNRFYFSLEEVNDDMTAIRILRHKSDLTLIDECNSDPFFSADDNYPCTLYGGYENYPSGITLENETTKEYPLKIFSHAPAGGFERICEHNLEMFNMCYRKILDLLAIEPETKELHYKIYLIDGTGSMTAGWDGISSIGNFENLSHFQKLIDEKIDNIIPDHENLEAGLCTTVFGHEMTHIFVAGTPISYDVLSIWNEGIAEYIGKRVNNYHALVNHWQKITCVEDGYYFSNKWNNGEWTHGEKIPYMNVEMEMSGEGDFTTSQFYKTGYCIWDYIEQTYGIEAIRNILADLVAHRNRATPARQCYELGEKERLCQGHIIEDFIIPHTDPSIMDVFHQRFGFKPERSPYLIPTDWEVYFGDQN